MSFHSTDAREITEAGLWLSRYWGKPTQPLYYSPKTLEETLSLLEEYGEEAKILAGGIDLLGLMKTKVLSPRVLVNVKALEELCHITEDADGVEIGALTRIHEIEASDLIRDKFPLLAEAAQSVGSPQIRNMATLGGNLCQEVRCWYYRRSPVTGISYDCRRKKKGGICYAVNGENENHAILGESECFAVSSSDMSAGLQALDARIRTISPRGERTLRVDEFCTPLGNMLQPDEIIRAIHVPCAGSRTKQSYLKFRTRKTIDFAIVSVATAVMFEENIVTDARIVIGGVSPIPYEAARAEETLKGEGLTEEVAERAASASVCEAMPLRKNGYKVPIVRALVKRALLGLKI